jgi:hypothetical protein
MRRTIALAALVLALCSGDDANALCGRRAARRAMRAAPACTQTAYATPYTAQPTPYTVTPSPQAFRPDPPGSSDQAAFLAALNAWRAAHGRGPLVWDQGLAGAAMSNTGVHDGRSSAGAMQTWAGTRSLTQALGLWQASPAHAQILLSGTTVGAGPSSTGVTANLK